LAVLKILAVYKKLAVLEKTVETASEVKRNRRNLAVFEVSSVGKKSRKRQYLKASSARRNKINMVFLKLSVFKRTVET
jgi:hypothetical protein